MPKNHRSDQSQHGSTAQQRELHAVLGQAATERNILKKHDRV